MFIPSNLDYNSILFWNRKTSSLAFHLAVGSGVLVGLLVATGSWPQALNLTDGKYDTLLSANIYGTVLSFVLFGIGSLKKD